MDSNKKFETAVSTIRSAIKRKANQSDEISSVDVSNVAPSIKGNQRGAAVREAFASLVREGFLKMTKQSVYNPDTRHSVSVYKTI